jgi:hypothetical protein
MVLVALLVYAWAGAVALARPISDFYAAGHAIPAAYNGMAIAACFVAALAYPTLAGVLGPGWQGSLLVLAGGAGALLAIAFLLAPYLRRFGGYTLPDFLGERFGSAGLRPLAVAAVFLCSFPALAAVLLALAVIVTRLFALDLPSSLAISAAVLGSPRAAEVELGAVSATRPGREIVDWIVAVDGRATIRGWVEWCAGGEYPLPCREQTKSQHELSLLRGRIWSAAPRGVQA